MTARLDGIFKIQNPNFKEEREEPRMVTGQFSGKSAMKGDDLKKFFEDQANAAGFTSYTSKNLNTGGTNIHTLAMGDDVGKSLNIVITEKTGGDTLVSTNYSETK